MNERVDRSWLEALSGSDPDARNQATAHLLGLGAEAIPCLMPIVRSPDSPASLSSLAAEILARISPSLGELVETLGHSELSARSTATYALACMGNLAVDALVETLGSESRTRRLHAAMALGRIGDPKAIPALVSLFRDSSSEVQNAAAFSLGQIGVAALPTVADATRDPDVNVRRLAVLAIAKIGHFKAMPTLSELMETEVDTEVKKAIRCALEGIMMHPGLIDTD